MADKSSYHNNDCDTCIRNDISSRHQQHNDDGNSATKSIHPTSSATTANTNNLTTPLHDIEDLAYRPSNISSCSRLLRSSAWFSTATKDKNNAFYHRSWMQNQGHPPEMFDGRPVIAIVNTWSGFTPCNGHLRELAQSVANGVREAGGFPLEVPVFSTGESCLRPTAMLYRNLAAMDVEELKANPVDGFVLLVGCDKTTPACLMGAASTDLPTIVVSGGPMLNGYFKGEKVGSGTTLWNMLADLKSGKMSEEEFLSAESAMSRSSGSCNTMGTASTMACMVESLGMSLSGNAAIPAVDARRKVLAHNSGKRIVDLVENNIKPSTIMTRKAFENAMVTLTAIGGSTNAIIHLLAIAGRVMKGTMEERQKTTNIVTLKDFDTLCSHVPTIVNLMPAGEYLMEEFYYAGGLPVVLKSLIDSGHIIHNDAMTVTGLTIGDNVRDAKNYNTDVIRSIDNPIVNMPSHIAVLYGNLSPNGSVIKLSAASKDLMVHTGRAVVFEDHDDYKERIDNDDLDVDKDCILVMKNCGLKGYPGMAEVGNMTLPAKVLKQGVRDMIRISDARMSGTAFGTVILHVSPEAAIGGPLALVHNGDLISVDIEKRQLNLLVLDDVLEERKVKWKRPVPPESGYNRLFHDHIEGPEFGADFDFLKGCRGAPVPKPCH